MMRPRQLEAFRAAIITGSLTATAAKLKVTQPTVSRLLSDLEADIGFLLFSRKKGRITPTSDGMLFYERVDAVHEVLAELTQFAEEIRRDRKTHLRIAATPMLATYIIPEIIGRFRTKHSNVTISIQANNIPQLMRALRAGEVDIVFTNKIGDMPDIVQRTFLVTDYICALPHGHALAQKSMITADDLDGEIVVKLYDPEEFDFTEHEDKLGAYKWWTESKLLTKQSSIAYSLIRNGVAIGLLEPFSAAYWQPLGVQTRPFTPTLRYTYSSCHSIGANRNNLAMAFLSYAEQHIREMADHLQAEVAPVFQTSF